MIRSEAFKGEEMGGWRSRNGLLQGKIDLEALEVHVPFLQLCKSIRSSIRSRTKVENSWILEKSWETFAEGRR